MSRPPSSSSAVPDSLTDLVSRTRWEELAEAPPAGQWAPFRVTPSTTTADDLHPN